MEERKIGTAKFIFLFIILFIIGIVLWSRFISTKGIKVNEVPLFNQNIPLDMDGLKIVHFSDLLYGRTVNKKDVTTLVKKINNLKPDIVIFTGDLIDKDTVIKESLTSFLTEELKKIDAKVAKYAIWGDYDYNTTDYEILLKNAEFKVLKNSSDLIYYNAATPIYIAGLDSSLKGNFDPNTTFVNLEEDSYKDLYKIALIHEPDNFDKIKEQTIDLVLSGHSLLGQIRLPFIGSFKGKNGSLKYIDDHYTNNLTNMYVNGGLGTTNYSFRFFNKPTINFYRLYAKEV